MKIHVLIAVAAAALASGLPPLLDKLGEGPPLFHTETQSLLQNVNIATS